MMPFQRLLVPHDLSPHADRALELASEIAGSKGKLLVLHVVTPFVAVPTTDIAALPFQVPVAEIVADAKRHLVRVVERHVGPDGPKTTIKVVVGDAYQSIIEHAKGQHAIVMSTRGRTGLAHLVIGSVAEKVVRHSEIPVLTFRPQAARASGARPRAA